LTNGQKLLDTVKIGKVKDFFGYFSKNQINAVILRFAKPSKDGG